MSRMSDIREEEPRTGQGSAGTQSGPQSGGVVRQVFRAPDKYGLLLLFLLADYVILSVGWTSPWSIVLATISVGFTALLAFHTSGVGDRWWRAELVAVGLALAASVVAVVGHDERARDVAFILMSLLVLSCAIVISSRILRHHRVTIQTLLGAICVYVLIGLLFAYVDFAYQLVSGTSYFAQPGQHGSPDFVYFSFITMTTLGYGDLSPAHGLPRTTAALEALTGQVFLVMLVARLVTLYTPLSPGAGRALMRGERLNEEPAAPSSDQRTVDDPRTHRS
jgi:hypothetical protein